MTHTFTERGGKGGRSWPQKCIDVNCGELVGQDVLTEFLSTFFLNLAIISLTVAFSAGTETVQAAFTIGFGVLVMVEGFGRFGETHINPAVSLAMMTLSRLSVWKGILYWVAQCLGSIAGAATIFYTLPTNLSSTIKPLDLHHSMETWQGAVIEGLITFLLVFVILGSTDEKRRGRRVMPAIPIGMTIVSNICWAGNYTGGAMNPALLIGPAVVTNVWTNHWAYWAGPMAGGFLAAIIYRFPFVALTKLDERQTLAAEMGAAALEKKHNQYDNNAYENGDRDAEL